MDHISAVISRYNRESGARLVAGCDDTDVAATCEPPPAPPATGPIHPDAFLCRFSELARGADRMFNEAVDRIAPAGGPGTRLERVVDAETQAKMDAIGHAISDLGRDFAQMWDTAVDRVIARVRAVGAETVRLRHHATATLGAIVIASRRSTSHGGRASQARGDDDPAPTDSRVAAIAAILHWNQEPSLMRGAVLCVSWRTL